MDHKLTPPASIFCWGEMKFECVWLGPLPLKDYDLFQWQGLLLKLCIDVGIQYGKVYPPQAHSTGEGHLIHAM